MKICTSNNSISELGPKFIQVVSARGKHRVALVLGSAFAIAALVLYIAVSTGFVIGLLAAAAASYAAFITKQGKEQLEKVGAAASGILGHPVEKNMVGAVLVLLAAVTASRMLGSSAPAAGFAGSGMPGGGGGGGAVGDDGNNIAMTLQEAYLLGFTDKAAGKESAPPAQNTRAYDPTAEMRAASAGYGAGYVPPVAEASSSGSGFGIGSLVSLFMLGSYLYRAGGGGGGGGWSFPMAIASIKANPMQGVMMLMMLSRLF